jgi:hypothetical protein
MIISEFGDFETICVKTCGSSDSGSNPIQKDTPPYVHD